MPGGEVPRGAFVSLHLGGRLRGCIGRLESDRPVAETVARMAVEAASEDPRFPPLAVEELAGLSVEVSVLTPPAPIRAEDVVPGRHGLIVARGPRRGVLLPQVATAHGWDRERFLAEVCRKAGLPPDAWRETGTALSGFEAQVIAEP